MPKTKTTPRSQATAASTYRRNRQAFAALSDVGEREAAFTNKRIEGCIRVAQSRCGTYNDNTLHEWALLVMEVTTTATTTPPTKLSEIWTENKGMISPHNAGDAGTSAYFNHLFKTLNRVKCATIIATCKDSECYEARSVFHTNAKLQNHIHVLIGYVKNGLLSNNPVYRNITAEALRETFDCFEGVSIKLNWANHINPVMWHHYMQGSPYLLGKIGYFNTACHQDYTIDPTRSLIPGQLKTFQLDNKTRKVGFNDFYQYVNTTVRDHIKHPVKCAIHYLSYNLRYPELMNMKRYYALASVKASRNLFADEMDNYKGVIRLDSDIPTSSHAAAFNVIAFSDSDDDDELLTLVTDNAVAYMEAPPDGPTSPSPTFSDTNTIVCPIDVPEQLDVMTHSQIAGSSTPPLITEEVACQTDDVLVLTRLEFNQKVLDLLKTMNTLIDKSFES